MANSPALQFSLTNANSTDSRFSLTLVDRGLPYETLQVGGKMRADFKWYPGSPVATVQVLGSEESDITVRGFWKERFIGDGRQVLVDGIGVTSVRRAMDALDGARRRGQPLVMTWGEVVRTVLITNLDQTWHNPYDCEWELTFGVIALDTIVNPTPAPTYQDLSAVQSNIFTGVSAWAYRGLSVPKPLRWDAALLAALSELDDKVLGLQNAITQSVQSVVGQATTPLNAARQLGAILTTAVNQLEAFGFAIMGQAESSIFAGFRDPDTVSYTEQALAGYSKTKVFKATRNLRDLFLETLTPQIASLSPPLTATFIASSEQDLRDVSTQFYGTPNNWRNLMQYNGLRSSRLIAGDLIWVPQQFNPGSGGEGR